MFCSSCPLPVSPFAATIYLSGYYSDRFLATIQCTKKSCTPLRKYPGTRRVYPPRSYPFSESGNAKIPEGIWQTGASVLFPAVLQTSRVPFHSTVWITLKVPNLEPGKSWIPHQPECHMVGIMLAAMNGGITWHALISNILIWAKVSPKTCTLWQKTSFVEFFSHKCFFYWISTAQKKLTDGFPIISPAIHMIVPAFHTMVRIDLR